VEKKTRFSQETEGGGFSMEAGLVRRLNNMSGVTGSFLRDGV
jgi:hypothetical protein